MKILTLAIAACLAASAAASTPITYEGTLALHVRESGRVSSAGDVDSPASALSDYWTFEVTSGRNYVFLVERLEPDLNPALWLFQGLFTDDTQFAGGDSVAIDESDPGFIAFADDEFVPALPGPFGDLIVGFTPRFTGTMTAIVTSFASGPSDGGDGYFDYGIVVAESAPLPEMIPLPATLPLLLGGTAALLGLARRRPRSRGLADH